MLFQQLHDGDHFSCSPIQDMALGHSHLSYLSGMLVMMMMMMMVMMMVMMMMQERPGNEVHQF